MSKKKSRMNLRLNNSRIRGSLHWMCVLNNGFDNPNPNLRLCSLTLVHIK